jgi:predicted porin
MLVCITSAVAEGQQVSVNYNLSQSFSSYHTYAWASNNTNQIQNSILAQVAQQDIDTAMQAGSTKSAGITEARHHPACKRRHETADLL